MIRIEGTSEGIRIKIESKGDKNPILRPTEEDRVYERGSTMEEDRVYERGSTMEANPRGYISSPINIILFLGWGFSSLYR